MRDDIFDVLVVGSGAAGLTLAVELAADWNVCVVTKATAMESATKYAQGGIAAVLRIDDDYQAHIEDTINAGGGLCDIEAVKILVHEAPARIRDLIALGVQFDTGPDNTLLFTREGGHRSWRVLHVGDMTGLAIEENLERAVVNNRAIQVREHTLVTDLIVRDGVCYGVIALDGEGKQYRLLAKTVYLATGGAGQLFSHTTNPEIATGDGLAMAARAGAVLQNLEFIQFHPTAFYKPPAPYFLISEAVRGEGGRLLNQRGELFMSHYHPSAELAPRDIVSRAIYAELNRTETEHVFLDISHRDTHYLRKRFPTITEKCAYFGVDITTQSIPVAPASHYFCGGVKTNIDGKTDIISLYAGGEVACTGVHGANRLASNSLLESVVFAYRAAVNVDRYLRYLPHLWYKRAQEADQWQQAGDQKPPLEEEMVDSVRHRLQDLMWRYCGVVRTDEGLRTAREKVKALQQEFGSNYTAHSMTMKGEELRNLLSVGRRVVDAAIRRRENVGTHFNRDREAGES